jgi:toxin-antitoxin system PIN domain toxin
VIAIDTNLLVYAHRPDSGHHAAAVAAMRLVVEGAAPWALPWPCVHEFLGIATHPKVFKPVSTLAEALAFVDSLLSSPSLHLLAESPGYFDKLRTLTTSANLNGPRIHDARIAALCLHHGVSELWSAGRDFAAFPQVKMRNPLVKTRAT